MVASLALAYSSTFKYALPAVIGVVAFIFGVMIAPLFTKKDPIQRALKEQRTFLLAYNLDTHKLNLLPLRMQGDVYVAEGTIPRILIKSPDDHPIPIANGKSQIYFGFVKGLMAMTEKIDDLAKYGIAQVIVGNEVLETSRGNPITKITTAIKELSNMEENKTLSYTLSPNAEIGFVFSPQKVAQSLAELYLERQRIVLEMAKTLHNTGKTIDSLLDKLFRPNLSGSGWKNTLLMIVVVAMVMGIIALVILHGGAPSTSTAVHTVTSTLPK